MNYQKIYDQLIQKRKLNVLNKNGIYCERHHIIPRSLGGLNDKINLVNLTAREHYIAHLLLWKIYKMSNNKVAYYKMANAVIRLMNGNSQAKINIHRYNSKLYEYAKIAAAKYLSLRPGTTKGKRFIHDILTHQNKMIDKNLPLPIGYSEGIFLSDDKRLKLANSTKGKIYIRNNITNELKQISSKDPIPFGWSKKRTKLNLTPKQKQIHRQNALNNKGQKNRIAIINDTTNQKKFIEKTDQIPIGWHKQKQIYKCKDCGKQIHPGALRSHKCANKIIVMTRKLPKKKLK